VYVSELMLLGFISLLLSVLQGPISNICISKAVGATWHPCNKRQESNNTKSYDNGHRRLLTISDLDGGGSTRRVLAAAGYDKCAKKASSNICYTFFIHLIFKSIVCSRAGCIKFGVSFAWVKICRKKLRWFQQKESTNSISSSLCLQSSTCFIV
jgi:hypothetical protein